MYSYFIITLVNRYRKKSSVFFFGDFLDLDVNQDPDLSLCPKLLNDLTEKLTGNSLVISKNG